MSKTTEKHHTTPQQRKLGRFFASLGIPTPSNLHLFDEAHFHMNSSQGAPLSDEQSAYEVYRYGNSQVGFVPVLEPKAAHS